MRSVEGDAVAPRRLGSFVLCLVFVGASSVTALEYGFGLGGATMQARYDTHNAILNGTAKAPDRYRWLVPAIIEGPTRLLSQWMPRDIAHDRVAGVYYVAAFTLLLWTQFSYLRRWFTDEQALVGALFIASTIRIAIRQHDYAPASFLEPSLVALALIAMLDGRLWRLALLIAIATFARETAIFIIAMYVVTRPLTRSTIVTAAGYFAIWLAIFTGVRLMAGDAERYWTVAVVFATNMSQPGLWAFNLSVFLGAAWLFALLGYRHAPPFVRQAAIVIVPYAFVVAVWGIWWEVRLLMTLYPLILPLALSFLFKRSGHAIPRWALAGIVVSAVAINAFDYSILVPQQDVRRATHQAVVDGAATGPAQYRVLVPFTLEPVIQALAPSMSTRAFTRVYGIYYFVALSALLIALLAWLRQWFDETQALAGALFVGSTIRVALRQGEYTNFAPLPESSVFVPASLLDPAVIAAGLILIAMNRRWLFGLLVVAAAVNSEVSMVLPLLFLAIRHASPNGWRDGAIYAALWAIVTLLPRLAWTAPAAEPSGMALLQENLHNLPTTVTNLALFFGPAWLLVATGWHRVPATIRQAALVVPVHLAGVLAFSYWWDVRLLMPLYALLVPMLLSSIFAGHARSA